MTSLCTNCGFSKASRKGRCDGCYKFLQRNGFDAPDTILEQREQRLWEAWGSR
jgi:predicted ATP-dependent serine protease